MVRFEGSRVVGERKLVCYDLSEGVLISVPPASADEWRQKDVSVMNSRSAWGGSNREHSRDLREDRDRYQDLSGYLSSQERAALRKRETGPPYPASSRIRLRLLSLGLVELSRGRLGPTQLGRGGLAAASSSEAAADQTATDEHLPD